MRWDRGGLTSLNVANSFLASLLAEWSPPISASRLNFESFRANCPIAPPTLQVTYLVERCRQREDTERNGPGQQLHSPWPCVSFGVAPVGRTFLASVPWVSLRRPSPQEEILRHCSVHQSYGAVAVYSGPTNSSHSYDRVCNLASSARAE